MASAATDIGPVQYTPESSPYEDMLMRQQGNVLQRVGNLPLVANTFDLMCSYYSSAKKTYPSVTPYLEFAEKVTSGAASVALSTTKPVVDRLAPTVNSYANRGLDKLEGVVPQICDEPDEIYGSAKAAVARRIDSALSKTEDYIDYYLPAVKEDCESSEDDSSDDESDTSSMDIEDSLSPKDRMQVLSKRVRQRAYNRAMNKFHGVQKRSVETLNRLQFTVDLISYAKDNMDGTSAQITTKVSAVNDAVKQRLATSQENVVAAWQEIKTRSSDMVAEVNVLEKARSLTKGLQESCSTLLSIAFKIPDGEYWTKNLAWAKDYLDTLVRDLSGKTSFRELSSLMIATAQENIQHAKQMLESLFALCTELATLEWLAPGFNSDPLADLYNQDLGAEPRMQGDNQNAAHRARQNGHVRYRG